MSGTGRRIVRGAIAGLAGTVAISLLSAAEARRRGRRAVYEPGTMAARIGRRAGLRVEVRARLWAGRLMRWPYGALWGAALGALAPRRPWPLQGAALGGAVLAFELIALPLTGATPPLPNWDRKEIAGDGINTLAYGLTVAAMLRLLTRAGR